MAPSQVRLAAQPTSAVHRLREPRVTPQCGVRAGDGLFGLDVGEPYDLAPFIGFISDELAEIGRRARERLATDVGKSRSHPRVGESCIYLPVELVDDVGG